MGLAGRTLVRPALDEAFARAPSLRDGLIAGLVTAVVGFAVNDSGVAVPAMALALAVPLTLVASLREPDVGTAIPEPPPSLSAPRPGAA